MKETVWKVWDSGKGVWWKSWKGRSVWARKNHASLALNMALEYCPKEMAASGPYELKEFELVPVGER